MASSDDYDVIGPWSEVKLEILKEYADAYTTILSKKNLYYIYIDAFAGRGEHVSKETGKIVPGSPINALNTPIPFREYHFIDINTDKIEGLKEAVGERDDVFFYNDDCHEVLLNQVYPRAKWEDYRRALCFLDPYNLHLKWDVIKKAGVMRSIELWLNFPIHDINRNVLRKNTDKVLESDLARMNALWGDDSWRPEAYNRDLFGQERKDPGNLAIIKAFQKRLKNEAGFKFVPKPKPMHNSKGGVVFYLFFAGPNETGARIARHVLNKTRSWR